MCLPLVYQSQGKWKYLHWNARLLFSLPSTGIRTVFPLFLPSGSLDIFLFCKKSKSLWRPFELSFQQPCFLDVTQRSSQILLFSRQLINVTWQSRNLIFSNKKGVCLNSDRNENLESHVKSVIWSYGFLFCINRVKWPEYCTNHPGICLVFVSTRVHENEAREPTRVEHFTGYSVRAGFHEPATKKRSRNRGNNETWRRKKKKARIGLY